MLYLKIFLSDRCPVKGVYSSVLTIRVESLQRRQSLSIRSATPIRYSGKLTVAALIRKGDILYLLEATHHLSGRTQTSHTLGHLRLGIASALHRYQDGTTVAPLALPRRKLVVVVDFT